MAKADITLRGRAYAIACAPGQEVRIRHLAEQLGTRVDQIADAVGDIGEERLLLIAALALLDELDAARNAKPPPDAERRAIARLEGAAARIDALAARIERGG